MGVFFLVQPGFAEPLGVDIKANGQDGSVTVPPSDPVSITIGLVAGDKAGQNADLWVAVSTPFDPPGAWYSFVHPAGWIPGINRCAQVGLFDLASFEIMNMVLPLGSYTFYFGVNDPHTSIFGPWWGLDSVEVKVGVLSAPNLHQQPRPDL